jgi:hypothetical protein
LPKLALINNVVIAVGHSVPVKTGCDILVTNDDRLSTLVSVAKGPTTAYMINMPMREDHSMKGIMRPRLDGADALFPPVLIGSIKSDQPLISLEDNAVREGFNNGEVRRQLG